jgi:hypothetical protein
MLLERACLGPCCQALLVHAARCQVADVVEQSASWMHHGSPGHGFVCGHAFRASVDSCATSLHAGRQSVGLCSLNNGVGTAHGFSSSCALRRLAVERILCCRPCVMLIESGQPSAVGSMTLSKLVTEWDCWTDNASPLDTLALLLQLLSGPARAAGPGRRAPNTAQQAAAPHPDAARQCRSCCAGGGGG